MAGFYALNIATQNRTAFVSEVWLRKQACLKRKKKKQTHRQKTQEHSQVVKYNVCCCMQCWICTLLSKDSWGTLCEWHAALVLSECPALCLSSTSFVWKLSYVFCFYLTYNVSWKKKETQWDNFELNFTGASFKTNSGLTLLYAVTLVYFCTYFV